MNVIQWKFIPMPYGLSFVEQTALLNVQLSDFQRNGFNILSVKPHTNDLPDGSREPGFMIEYREGF